MILQMGKSKRIKLILYLPIDSKNFRHIRIIYRDVIYRKSKEFNRSIDIIGTSLIDNKSFKALNVKY